MIFLVRACEGIYEGLHGIETVEILEARNLDEIYSIATEMSIELMGSYSIVIDELERYVEEEIESNDTVNWTEERIDELRSEIYNENVCYDIYELNEEKIKDISYRELEEEAYNDLEEFLINYQKDNELL